MVRLTAFALTTFASVSIAASPCNTDNAVHISTLEATFTFQATTLRVSGGEAYRTPAPLPPSSSSSPSDDELESETNTELSGDWLDRGGDAADDIGGYRRRRRDVEEDFECTESSEICAVNDAMAPFCIVQPTGDFYSSDGAVGNFVSGIYAVDGESGDLYYGPCPGEHYRWNETDGYCQGVPSQASTSSTLDSATEEDSTSGTSSGSESDGEDNDGSGSESSGGGQSDDNAASSVSARNAAGAAALLVLVTFIEGF